MTERPVASELAAAFAATTRKPVLQRQLSGCCRSCSSAEPWIPSLAGET